MKILLVVFLLTLCISAAYAQGPVPVDSTDERGASQRSTKKAAPTTSCVDLPSEPTSYTPSSDKAEFEEWLRKSIQKKRLLRIIPVTDGNSLFMFANGKSTYDPYYVRKFDDFSKSGMEAIQKHIDDVERELAVFASSQQFLGIHRLAGDHYFLVFYYEK